MDISNIGSIVHLWLKEDALSFFLTILGAVVIVLLAKVVIEIIKKVLQKIYAKSKRINDLMAKFLLKVIAVSLWVLVSFLLLLYFGVNPAPILATLGITGFILGFAFQETLGNLLAGVMIVLNGPFRIGDFVEVASVSGTVRDMDMMSVTLTSTDNKRVILSNKLIWGKAIINYSYTDKRRVDMGVIISYDSDIEKAKKVILDLLESYSEVFKEPKTLVAVNRHNEYSVGLTIRPWVKPADYWSVYFRFHQEILAKFKEEGIKIPLPQMEMTKA
ncbi:MAG: mechanosensitive ion channel family protein [Sphaerochaetaceae bacterium]|jgi:small conductance mechanosensitive channel